MVYKAIAPAAVVLVALILVHGLIPEEFLVDSTTVGLLVLLAAVLAIPYFPSIRQYISELNILGSGVKFREEAEKAAEEAEAIAEKRKPDGPEHLAPASDEGGRPQTSPWPIFVDMPEHLYELIERDPRLAVVGLSIEVERAIFALVRGAGIKDTKSPKSLAEAISRLRATHTIDAEEEGLLSRLLRLRSLALHGADMDVQDARTFFSTVESLNDFAVGFSLNLSPNEEWEEQGTRL